ncbi:MAG: CapA family protein [Desulfuromonadales bacterium]|nr:CapA family protein [Desulfuromonadales bacterium]
MKFAALGDIAFCGHFSSNVEGKVFQDVSDFLCSADVVIGNLEGPLTVHEKGVPDKCRLSGYPGWAKALKHSGVGVVSLANNHTMDYGIPGLNQTLDALKEAGIVAVGAGHNIKDALAPAIIHINGFRVAILARTSVHVSSHSRAGKRIPGVAFFDQKETADSIKAAKGISDIVVLLMHWGLEEYQYPTPDQKRLAYSLISAGADVILGHHPHVVQGIEYIENKLVAYSLGNFLFDDFGWYYHSPTEGERYVTQKLNKGNRKGMILKFEVDPGSGFVQSVFPVFTLCEKNGPILIDQSPLRKKEFNRIGRRLKSSMYATRWQLHALSREWDLRIRPMLFPNDFFSKLKKLRFHHVHERMNRIGRSIRVLMGKTTNPYE